MTCKQKGVCANAYSGFEVHENRFKKKSYIKLYIEDYGLTVLIFRFGYYFFEQYLTP